MNKFEIPLESGHKLVVEQNTGEFDKEIFIGIDDESGKYIQDLAIVRPTYKCVKDDIIFGSDKFEILVFGDAGKEDFTEKFTVPLRKEDDE